MKRSLPFTIELSVRQDSPLQPPFYASELVSGPHLQGVTFEVWKAMEWTAFELSEASAVIHHKHQTELRKR